jgi:hypothetical protein
MKAPAPRCFAGAVQDDWRCSRTPGQTASPAPAGECGGFSTAFGREKTLTEQACKYRAICSLQAMANKSDFMAAEEIKAILHGRDKAEQERVIRWVSESLGILGVSVGGIAPAIVPPLTPLPIGQPAQHGGIGHKKDIKTFVSEKKPKSDVQFATVMAYFYRFEVPQGERKEVILPQELQDAGRQARGFGFKEPLKTLSNAVALGYFDRAGRGEFKLNAVGENLVAMTLPGTDSNGKRLTRPKSIKSKRGKK